MEDMKVEPPIWKYLYLGTLIADYLAEQLN